MILTETEYYCLCITVPENYLDKAQTIIEKYLYSGINLHYVNPFKETRLKNYHCDIIINGVGIAAWQHTNKIFNVIKSEIPEHVLGIYEGYEHNRVNFGNRLLKHVTMA